jgi:hypothetical protein
MLERKTRAVSRGAALLRLAGRVRVRGEAFTGFGRAFVFAFAFVDFAFAEILFEATATFFERFEGTTFLRELLFLPRDFFLLAITRILSL